MDWLEGKKKVRPIYPGKVSNLRLKMRKKNCPLNGLYFFFERAYMNQKKVGLTFEAKAINSGSGQILSICRKVSKLRFTQVPY